MKAEDLRIGNKFLYYTGAEAPKTWKEIEINLEALAWAVNEPARFNAGFKPIPLTPEWLERAGAKKESTKNYDKKDYEWIYNIKMGIFDISVCKYTEKNGGDIVCYLWEGTPVKLPHVHLLQNLWHALSHNELKFNL